MRRLVLDKDKFLISKPGFDVLDPALADENKIFDSRWPFSLTIIQRGYYFGDETPPSSAPFTTFHFFGERDSRPLLVTERIPKDTIGGFSNTGPGAPVDVDSLNHSFTIGSYNIGIDENFDNGTNQELKLFSDRFEIEWTGFSANKTTYPFLWTLLALPASQQ